MFPFTADFPHSVKGVTLPEQWSDWQLVTQLGNGSYGTVYLMEQKNNPSVKSAVKLICLPMNETEHDIVVSEYGNNMESIKNHYKMLVNQYRKEVDALKEVQDCPNIVQCQDFCIEPQDNPYGWNIFIRMELLTPFPYYCKYHVIDETKAIQIGIDLCNALSACHARGIIHRDIKPDNILVTENHQFKLGDFGMAKNLNTTRKSMSMKGTFSYMAPEVHMGHTYDERADIYSLGLVLYRLLNHNREPLANMQKQILNYQDREDAMNQRLAGASLPPPVDASEGYAEIVLRACQYKVEDRYQSIDEMLHDLVLLSKGEYRLQKDRIKREKKKKLLRKVILLTLIAVIAAFAGSKALYTAYNTVGKGSCGEDATWKIYRNGNLIVEGTGATEASEEMSEYTSFVKTIEVEDGITEIGPETFAFFEAVTDVSLPDSVQSIEHGAFGCCSALVNINLPYGLTEIADETFVSTHISSIEIPETVTKIGEKAFSNSDLVSVDIPDNVSEIGNESFSTCIYLEEIELPDKLSDIGARTFEGCSALTNIKIPDKVELIGIYAFAGCSMLKSIDIPENVKAVGVSAFESCESLEDVTLPDNISIGENAFHNTKWEDNNFVP